MTADQQQAFYDASGFHAASLSFDTKLMVGSVSLLCALFILVGLMHLLNSDSAWDKVIFVVCLFMLSFILMLIFTYCA